MSADRETNHPMAQHAIALLLADAADEVEIGIAPTQALIRGGRRRKARRWAVTAGTALVAAGSTGALALTGLPGGGDRVAPAAPRPAVTGSPSLFQPHNRVTLATGTDAGVEWRVSLDVWPAPIDAEDARSSMDAMAQYGETPGVTTPEELVGRSAWFVHRGTTSRGGVDREHVTVQGLTTEDDMLSGKDIDAVAVPLSPVGEEPDRLVIGHVAKTARQVTCTWKDGTTTKIHRVPAGADINSDDLAIRTTDGSPYNWFVCLAPKGTEYKSAQVTG
ncbi:hypothetical protein [Streptomyces sp. NBC_00582]|uniref:hypothetical protein n=1 Tax=Streptomyces sp. NBC_00582 TaxID=2975783 RepID=UPI0010DD68A7|nr:hypothetical protein [Streptomyces sp. NBC_00582]WUB65074.1 hypothetical protein OG852_34065 [Streptomyces sp. NBC_00582]